MGMIMVFCPAIDPWFGLVLFLAGAVLNVIPFCAIS